jgi:hypothetical protein
MIMSLISREQTHQQPFISMLLAGLLPRPAPKKKYEQFLADDFGRPG